MAGWYLRYIVGDSIIIRIDEKRLSKNRLVNVHDFRGATLADINYYIIPILKKKPDVIILFIIVLRHNHNN